MLPQGSIWQNLRQCALDTVIQGCRVPFSSPPTLDAWLLLGANNVASVSTKRFLLHSSAVEIGSALLSDASFYADHAIEHSVIMRNHLSCGRWHSPAWLAVTSYYWAFYSTLALTRILGRTIWFISPERIATLHRLSSPGAVHSGPGPYRLICGSMLSSGQREIELKRSSQSRLHDAVWQLWFDMLRQWVGPSNVAKSTDQEVGLYLAQVRSANVLGNAWPSDLRNLLNYRPGVGYGAVRKITPSAIFNGIATDPADTISEIVSRIESNAAALQSGVPLFDQIAVATKLMVNMAIVMDVIATLLLKDVSERRHIDRRWLDARLTFSRQQSKPFTNRPWPCRSTTTA